MILYLNVFFLVVAAIQCIYLIAYTISIGQLKPLPTEDLSNQEGVSVIICACNELDNLRNNLPAILTQDHNKFEVVLVNDRSSDHSYEFLLKLKKEYPLLKVVQVDDAPHHVHPKKYAITLGIKAAIYDRILLTDADCWPTSDKWITSMQRGFSNSKQLVLGVSLYNKGRGFLNIFIRFETWLTAIQYVGRAIMGSPYMGVGRNLAYRKSLFLEKKGFHGIQDVTGGDDDLFVNKYATKKNTSVVLGKDSLMYSIPKTTWSSFFRQKIRHLSAGKRYKFTDKIILGIFSLTHILFWLLAVILTMYEPYMVLAGLVIRWFCLFVLFHLSNKRFGEIFVPFILPLLDFVYAIYYISAGTVAAFSKRIKWS